MQEKEQQICIKFGKHLQKIRLKKGKTAEKVAYENDLAISTVTRIEKGEVNPKLVSLVKIAESLEISLSDLVKF